MIKIVIGALAAIVGAFLGLIGTDRAYDAWLSTAPCNDTGRLAPACMAPSTPLWTLTLGAVVGAVILVALALVIRVRWIHSSRRGTPSNNSTA